MKKTIMLLLGVATLSANAASFAWGTGSVKASFGTTVFNTSTYQVTAYLVYLGSTAASADTSSMFSVNYTGTGSITGADSVSTASPTVTGGNANKGKVVGSYEGNISNGYSYGMYMTYIDSEGVSWFNFSSDVYTVSGLADATSSLSDAVFGFNFSTTTEITSSSQSVSAGGGWYSISVPEPSTAALALAGLTLLLKRRKA